jgi:hypothetical protein
MQHTPALWSLPMLPAAPQFGGAGGAQEQQHQYAVYIDAGSSGTRVHVFRYIMSPWPAYVHLELPEVTHSVEPGLSHYAGQPVAAAKSLQHLLEFAYEQVGMSLLCITERNKGVSSRAGRHAMPSCMVHAAPMAHGMHTRAAAQHASRSEHADVLGDAARPHHTVSASLRGKQLASLPCP